MRVDRNREGNFAEDLVGGGTGAGTASLVGSLPVRLARLDAAASAAALSDQSLNALSLVRVPIPIRIASPSGQRSAAHLPLQLFAFHFLRPKAAAG